MRKEQKDVKIVKWVDKGPVLIITSCPTHDDNSVQTGLYNILVFKCVGTS